MTIMADPEHSTHPPGIHAWREKTPTVIQMEAVECGAAALGIILGYHKKYVALEKLRSECGVSRDGSKASNVLKAARKMGLVAKGFKQSPEEVLQMNQPCILFWNFNHFVVLEGADKKKIYLNDPASGPKKISYEEFQDSFTGVVLTFRKGDDFAPSGKKPSLTKGIINRIRDYKTPLLFVTLTGLCLVLPGLLMPTFTKIFIDRILVDGMTDWLRPLLLVMVVTLVMQGTLLWLQSYYLLRMQSKMALASSAKFFWHMLRLPVSFFNQRYAGDIGSRVSSNDNVASLLAGPISSAGLNVMMVVFYAALMLSYDVILTCIGVVTVVMNIIALRYVSRVRMDNNTKLIQDSSKLYGMAQNGLSSIETIKASGGEDDFFSSISGKLAKVVNAQQKLAIPTNYLNALPSLLEGLTTVAVLCVGGLRVMNGDLSIGALIAFQMLMSSFIAPVHKILELANSMQDVSADIKRLDDVLNHETIDIDGLENHADDNAAPIVKLTGQLELKNISFGYNPLEKPLIENFNLSLKPGSRVALVGGSGSGKSTVAKLIMGLFQPWSGDILFDGKERESYARDTLTHSCAIVDQDIYLFEGSIRENITLWNLSIPEDQIVMAGKAADIHDTIMSRPDGYDAMISEGGVNFSGGQRQRLEIARALVRKPSILVLDEATSALDPATEKKIDREIRKLGCTCVIVAHRLSTIRDCDEIIVMDNGIIAERGTHEELKKLEGVYARLIKE